MSTDTANFKAFCDLEIWGEINMPLEEWVDAHLKVWKGESGDQSTDRLIDYATTTTADGGVWGLMYVQFWITTPIEVDNVTKAREIIEDRISRMWGDKIYVRFIKRLT